MEKQMKIKLDIKEIPDEVYNGLLMEFVKKAIIEGIDVPRGAKVEEWNLTAEINLPVVH
jgi:formylmethanofuran:tetrahydromethanopterin formyltransferase